MREPFAVRERTEDFERASLSTWATIAAETKGRDRYEELDPLRTVFQEDRDRVVSSAAFSRLKDKGESPLPAARGGDGAPGRDRLTHTLHVVAFARALGRALRLNEDLVEAIGLAHRVGAPPFAAAGVAGVSALTGSAFSIGEQSLRVVEELERDGEGLNLTWETRDGVLHADWDDPLPATLEGQVVRLAARVVTVLATLRDALDVGVVTLDDLPRDVVQALGRTHAERLATLLRDAVSASLDQPVVALHARCSHVVDLLVDLLAARVERSRDAASLHDRGVHCLESLGLFYLHNPAALPGAGDNASRVIDRLTALTDRAALAEFQARFLPSARLG